MSTDGSALPPIELTPLDFSAPQQLSAAPTTTCTNCSRQIDSVYYEVNGAVVCAPCRGKLSATIATTGRGGRVARAMGLGFLAALAGAVVYYAIYATTGYEIGLTSILVGWGVGRAVFIGSGKRGGRGYQLMAAGLTYLAISMAYVAIVKNAKDDGSIAATHADSSAAVTAATPAAGGGSDSVVAATTTHRGAKSGSADAKEHHAGIIAFLVAMVLLLAVPVLVGFSSPISLLIMIFGLVQAWRMNKRIEIAVTGPYRLGGAAAPQEG